MTTTADLSNVPMPDGAVRADEWQPDGPLTYRVFEGEQRHLGDGISVWTHGVQYQDGLGDNGTREQRSRDFIEKTFRRF